MDGRGQRCLEFELDVSSKMRPGTYMDGYGNHVHYFNLVRNHQGLSVIGRSVVETGGELETDHGEDILHLRHRLQNLLDLAHRLAGPRH